MKRHNHRKKTRARSNLTREELVYQAAENMAADMGISFSEALGFTLGIENPAYGWENDLSEEELEELINSSCDFNPEDSDEQDSIF